MIATARSVVRLPLLLLLTATLTAVMTLAAPGAWGYAVDGGATFNNPVGSSTAKWRIVLKVERAIDHTCPGGCAVRGGQTILISTFLMDRRRTADKLLAAHRRGVNVQIVMDSNIDTDSANRLVSRLGKADKDGDGRVTAYDDAQPFDNDPTDQRSFAIKCKDSCRGGWGNNHAKLYAFSRTGETSDVVMVSSANLNAGGALNGWNDMFTMVQRPEVYGLYRRVHEEMAEDDPFDETGAPIKRAYIEEQTGGLTHRFFPRKRAGRELDPTYQQLNKIDCTGTSGGAGKNNRTVVKIAMFWWSGPRGMYLADKVVGLDRAGCDVQVNYGAPSSDVSAKLRRSAHNGGIKLWDSRQRQGSDGKPTLRVHNKYLLVNGAYGGDSSNWRVMTGTQNWVAGALTGSDENTVEVASRHAYVTYSNHFEWLKQFSRRVGR